MLLHLSTDHFAITIKNFFDVNRRTVEEVHKHAEAAVTDQIEPTSSQSFDGTYDCIATMPCIMPPHESYRTKFTKMACEWPKITWKRGLLGSGGGWSCTDGVAAAVWGGVGGKMAAFFKSVFCFVAKC